MRYPLILTLIVISTITLRAQVLGKFYYNKHWELTKKDSAEYVRICKYDTALGYFTGPVTDMYMNGSPQMKGNILSVQKQGEFTTYYRNGQLESIGNYELDRRVGTWKYYHPNGNEKMVVQFLDNGYRMIFSMKDSTGVDIIKDGKGPYTETAPIYRGGERTLSGNFYKFNPKGRWVGTANGEKVFEDNFSTGGYFTGGIEYVNGKKKISAFAHNPHLNQHFKYPITESIIAAPGMTFADYPLLRWMIVDHERIYNFRYLSAEAWEKSDIIEPFMKEFASIIRWPRNPPPGMTFDLEIHFDILDDGRATNITLKKICFHDKLNDAVLKTSKLAAAKLIFPTKMKNGVPVTELTIPFKVRTQGGAPTSGY